MSIKHFSSGVNAKENKWQKKTVTATATTFEQQEKHATIAMGKKAHS